MKKLIIGIILSSTLFVAKGFSAGLYDVGNVKVFRTTAPAVAMTKMFIASGTIYVDEILVTSTSVGAESTVILNNSTGAFNGGVTLTTYTYYTGFVTLTNNTFSIPVHRVFPSGLLVTNTGTAKIEIRYDWLNGKAQPGKESTGW